MKGYNDFENIKDYADANKEWLEDKLKLWNGIPCAGTINNVFRVIPAEQFLKIFMVKDGVRYQDLGSDCFDKRNKVDDVRRSVRRI